MMDYVQIMTTGNAIDFGDLSITGYYISRWLFKWSWRFRIMSDIKINNITNRSGDGGPVIAGVSTVSSSAFMVMPSGDTAIRGAGSGRAVFVLGATPSVVTTMDYFDTATTGNAIDFGNASVARYQNGHGGMHQLVELFAGGIIHPSY